MTKNSVGSVGVSRQVVTITPFAGQWVAGWATSTQTDTDGVVVYGMFTTKEEALEWANNLINAVVFPIYVPSTNAG